APAGGRPWSAGGERKKHGAIYSVLRASLPRCLSRPPPLPQQSHLYFQVDRLLGVVGRPGPVGRVDFVNDRPDDGGPFPVEPAAVFLEAAGVVLYGAVVHQLTCLPS